MPRESRRHLMLPGVIVAAVLLGIGVAGAHFMASGDSTAQPPTTTGHASTPPASIDTNPAPDSTLAWSGLTGTVTPGRPCGGATGHPSRVAHVIVLVLENHSYGQVIGRPGSAVAKQAPYLNSLARRCGIATRYRSITHPSLPNYLAITGGSTHGLAKDVNSKVAGPSIFSALDKVGGNWAVYAEDMPSPCWPHRTSPLGYTPHHNPMRTYANLTADCKTHDLALGSPTSGPLAGALRNETLPSYSFVVPSLGHDMHTGSIGSADRWLSQWIGAIVSSPTYRDQSTAIFITADEGSGGHIGKGEICSDHPFDQSCHVPLVVISRYVRPGTRVRLRSDHYSLLRTTAELLGVPAPGAGATATSLRQAFGL
jgi:phosphatidylinositol-3-phosphatase